MKNQGKLVLFCRGKRIWRHLLKNISRWSRAGGVSQTDDGAYFRQEALSSATTARFFARKHYRRRRRCVFSPGSTIVGDDGAFFRQEGLSSATTERFFVRKPCRRRRQGIFSSGSTSCNANSAFFHQEAEIAMQLPLPGEKKLRMQGPFIPLRKKICLRLRKPLNFFFLFRKRSVTLP